MRKLNDNDLPTYVILCTFEYRGFRFFDKASCLEKIPKGFTISDYRFQKSGFHVVRKLMSWLVTALENTVRLQFIFALILHDALIIICCFAVYIRKTFSTSLNRIASASSYLMTEISVPAVSGSSTISVARDASQPNMQLKFKTELNIQ